MYDLKLFQIIFQIIFQSICFAVCACLWVGFISQAENQNKPERTKTERERDKKLCTVSEKSPHSVTFFRLINRDGPDTFKTLTNAISIKVHHVYFSSSQNFKLLLFPASLSIVYVSYIAPH